MDISTQVQQCELDSHADTCCLGNGCQILYKTGKADVGSFLEQLGELIKMKIVTAALAYDQPEMGQVYLLIFYQVLLIEGMQHHLLNPNQIREAVTSLVRHHSSISQQEKECQWHTPLSQKGIFFTYRVNLMGLLAFSKQETNRSRT